MEVEAEQDSGVCALRPPGEGLAAAATVAQCWDDPDTIAALADGGVWSQWELEASGYDLPSSC